MLREAVTNTARHAHATELTVTITVGADLLIDVTDNGTGIPGDRRPRRTAQPRRPRRSGRSTIDQPGGGGHPTGRGGGTRLVWAAPLQ